MEIKNLKLKSKQDDLELGLTLTIPDPNAEIKGIVQISHGMSEHRGRYLNFMEFLTNNGYVCIINDHRGHGESVKSDNDLGYFYDNSASFIVEDLYQVTQYIKSLYPNLPLTLFGHSMGSLVVRCYIKKYDSEINRLIVSGSPSYISASGIAILLVKLLALFKGDNYRSSFIHNTAFGNYNKAFKEVNSENEWLSSKHDEVDKYDNDPKCGFIFTLNGFENLFKLMKNVYSKKNWTKNNLKLPILFIAGKNDPVIINENKFMHAYSFLNTIGYENVEHILYPGKRHELLNEDINSKVYQDILDFINKTVK